MPKSNTFIGILQPQVPHYRDDFFSILREHILLDIYIYNSEEKSLRQGFQRSKSDVRHIRNWQRQGLLLYNPIQFLFRKYDVLVLMLHFAHITTWLLLLTKPFHRKKIILWGQGISVKRYLKEKQKPDWKLKWMIKLADGAWIYMDKECEQWKRIFPDKPIVALGNSLTGVEDMVKYQPSASIDDLRSKYGISQHRIFIFCARFESPYRRVDLLEAIIQHLDATENGFVIIGAGKFKPDFSRYNNVYEFGAVYDNNVKRELFCLSDLYLQPGWVGLSIVEAMAYGKPICTFKRSEETLQCVEYSYIIDGYNGMIFNSLEDCFSRLSLVDEVTLSRMSENARDTAKNHTPKRMVENAISIF